MRRSEGPKRSVPVDWVDGWMMTQTQVGKQTFIYNLHAYVLKYIYNFLF